MEFGDSASCNPREMTAAFGFDLKTKSFVERNGSSMFRRYDDGWRLESVDMGFPKPADPWDPSPAD
jgi:hypothetical protein